MSEQENIQIVRKLFDNLNNHNPDANNQLFAGDVRTEATGAPGVMSTREQGQMYTRRISRCLPGSAF